MSAPYKYNKLTVCALGSGKPGHPSFRWIDLSVCMNHRVWVGKVRCTHLHAGVETRVWYQVSSSTVLYLTEAGSLTQIKILLYPFTISAVLLQVQIWRECRGSSQTVLHSKRFIWRVIDAIDNKTWV